tara:strand:+ start:1910 stop:5485 length:3576 start_codon:yes stop_codon:yes gene_type:complete
MSKNALPLLTGGLNEVTRSDIIDNTELQVCDNYEVTGDGVLSKRGGIEEYDSELNTFLGTIFDSIISISQPFYSSNIIKPLDINYVGDGDQSNEFVLLIYGIKDSNYVLHMVYKNATEWTNTYHGNSLNTLLSEENVEYTVDSELEFTLGQDKIIITDNVNRAHFFSVNSDGSAIARMLGIPSPTQRPSLENSKVEESFDIDFFTEDASEPRVGTPGYVQIAYTVVSKTGEESNPSPLSNTLDLSIHQFDEDSGRTLFIDKILVSNLAIPDVSKNQAEDLESFNIYLKILPYKSGLSTDVLELSQNFKINQRFDEDGNVLFNGQTGNTYELTIEPVDKTISYENDKAPVAKTAAHIGGVTMLGNISSPIEFPYKFKYFHPISISNINANNYVDSVICVEIKETDIGNNGEFVLTDFFEFSSETQEAYIKDEALRCLRFYDNDLTTPLHAYFAGTKDIGSSKGNVISETIYESPSANNFFRIFLKIPHLMAGQSKEIYFCWCSDSADLGVPESENTIDSGKIQQPYDVSGIWWKDNTVWNAESIIGPEENSIATLNFENTEGENTSLFNKANRSNPGNDPSASISASRYQDEDSGYFNSNTPHTHAFLKSFLVRDDFAIGNDFLKSNGDETNFINTSSALHFKSFYCTFALSIKENDFVTEIGPRCLFSLAHSSNKYVTLIIDRGEAGDIYGSLGLGGFKLLIAKDNISNSVQYDLNEELDLESLLTHNTGANDDSRTNLYVCISIDGGYSSTDAKLSVFFMPLDNDNYNFRKIISFEKILTSDTEEGSFGSHWNYHDLFDDNMDGVKYAGTGKVIPSPFGVGSLSFPHFDSVNFVKNTYLSASDSSDKEMVWNIFNNQSPFKHTIGMYFDFDDNTQKYNKNIFFNKTKEIEIERFRNMVRWSDVGSDAVPDLFFKKIQEPVIKIIDAPSFLQYQYQNTFLIFSRNSIHRFVLEANASGWSGNASSLIQEKTQYGLLAPNTLVRVAEGLFWLSETGVVKWDNEGFKLISKNRVDIPIEENSIAFYSSLKNQYIILHSNVAYVYHIDRDLWTKFTGNDISNILNTAILTGGSELDNVNLILKNNLIMKYPSGTSDDSSSIKTKDMFFEKGVLKRVQLNYESDNKVTFKSNVTKNKADGTEVIKTNTIENIENGKYRGVANANSRGKSVNFEVENADEIESIIYDILLQGQVKQ